MRGACPNFQPICILVSAETLETWRAEAGSRYCGDTGTNNSQPLQEFGPDFNNDYDFIPYGLRKIQKSGISVTVLKPPSTLYIVCGNDLQYLDIAVCFADQVEVGTKVVRVLGQRGRAGGCCGGRRSGRDTTPVQYSTVAATRH